MPLAAIVVDALPRQRGEALYPHNVKQKRRPQDGRHANRASSWQDTAMVGSVCVTTASSAANGISIQKNVNCWSAASPAQIYPYATKRASVGIIA
jgi:uncharacterized membrane protein